MNLAIDPFDRVYIAGPLTGLPDGNKAAFAEVASLVKAAGGRPLNPHDFGFGELDTYEMCMRGCLRRLTSQQKPVALLIALRGWQRSKGASFEVATARVVGIPVMCQEVEDGTTSTFLGIRLPDGEDGGHGWLL